MLVVLLLVVLELIDVVVLELTLPGGFLFLVVLDVFVIWHSHGGLLG